MCVCVCVCLRVNVFACEDWVCNKYSHNNNNILYIICVYERSRPHKSRRRICGYDFVVPAAAAGGRRIIIIRYYIDKIVLFVRCDRATAAA